MNSTKKEDASLASSAQVFQGEIVNLELDARKSVYPATVIEKRNFGVKPKGAGTAKSQNGGADSQVTKTRPKSDLSGMIGKSLQSVYNDILQQPVPDRFVELLRQLEAGQNKTPSSTKKENS